MHNNTVEIISYVSWLEIESAPNHQLNHSWPTMSEVLCYSPEGIYIGYAEYIYPPYEFEYWYLKIAAACSSTI